MPMLIDPYRFGITDPDFQDVALLLTAQNGALLEWSGVPHLDLYDGSGVSGISSAQAKFGTTSYHNQNEFVDHTNYVDAYDDVDLTRFVYPGEFTMEGWFFWVTDGGGALSTLFANAKTPSAGYFFLGVTWNSGGSPRRMRFFYNASGSESLDDLTLPFNQWVHVAITRDASNVVRVFLDGVPSATQPTIVGSFGGIAADGFTHFTVCEGVPFVSADFDGYFDQIRVTPGVCRYDAPFTPPTEPFPTG
jgi:hypothetical protein